MENRAPNLAAKKHELLTSAEAAEFLRISRPCLEKWRHRRRGPDFVRVGSRCLYPRESLERYLRARMVAVET